MPERKPRIGIVLTVGAVEAKKDELIALRRKVPPRPWVLQSPKEFHIDRKQKKHRNATKGIPSDVAIGAYVAYKYGHTFDVDYITPEEITTERLKSNDLNFFIIYDLLEAFHTDKSKAIFNRLKDVLRKADNIFPNLDFQEFVYSKLIYYNHFEARGLPIVPTITLSKEEWIKQVALKKNWVTVANDVLAEVQRRKLDHFIMKPVYGQEAKGVMVFETGSMDSNSYKQQFKDHLRLLIEKYPGVIIQEYIDQFGEAHGSPELRMYFIGKEYQYTTIGMVGGGMYVLKEDGNRKVAPAGERSGWFQLPPIVDFQKMKKIALRAIDNMPSINVKRGARNISLPSLLTRVDMGCIRNGIFDPWINEVEFVPSLYVEDHTWPIDALMGDQMVRITKQFLGIKKAREQINPRRLRLYKIKKTKANSFSVGKIRKVLAVRFSAKSKRSAACKQGRGASRHVIKRGKVC